MQPLEAEPIFVLPTLHELASITARLAVAAVLAGAIGWERERLGKAAGLRTHMVVALGSALFVMAARETGMAAGDLSRVVQGIATGIGFVGAGAILKSTDHLEVHGLTTAATIWLTSAVGMAVGSGALWLPTVGVALALLILSVLRRIEHHMG
ncbi:MAG TPA: MgtC/SapB family protein [Candidatus Binatia bacterium]|nr:MgtC/SapB family protein [Candidatus Binatia bacterium]